MSYKSEDLVWMKDREFVKESSSTLLKILYYLGIVKPTVLNWDPYLYRPERKGGPKQSYNWPHFCMRFGYRWWNPITLILVAILIILTFFIKGVSGVRDGFKDGLYMEIHVNKSILKKDGSGSYNPYK